MIDTERQMGARGPQAGFHLGWEDFHTGERLRGLQSEKGPQEVIKLSLISIVMSVLSEAPPERICPEPSEK